MSGSFTAVCISHRRQASGVTIVAGLLLASSGLASGTPPPLVLPLHPCHGSIDRCLPRSGPNGWVRRGDTPRRPAVTLPIPARARPTTEASRLRLRVTRLKPHTLGLYGLVTPERLLSTLSSRTKSEANGNLCYAAGSAHLCSRTIVLVDGKRWRPGGLLGYTEAAIPARWISHVDVLENTPATDPKGTQHAKGGDPGIVDVILHRLRVSGEASVTAGVLEGGGAYSGANAEDYNILLDARDREGDSFLFDFNYEHVYGPWWYAPP